MLANFKKNFIESTAWKVSKAVLSNIFHYLHKKFLWGVFRKIDEKFFKFLFVGALNTLFSYTLYAIFVTIGLVANVALFFQYILGVLWNFKTTGSIVFKNNNNRLLFKFVISYVFTFILNSIFLKLLTFVLNDYISQAILVLPMAIISFLIFKFWVFKNTTKNVD